MEAGQAMRQAATEVVSTFEDTNATLDPGMPVTSFHEPGFVFVFEAGFGTITTFRKDLDSTRKCNFEGSQKE